MKKFVALSMLLVPAVQASAGELADRYGGYLQAQTALLHSDDGAALEGYVKTLGHGSVAGVAEDEWRARALQLALIAGDVPTAVQLAKTLPVHPKDAAMVWLVRMAAAAKEGNATDAMMWAQRLQAATPELLQFDLMRAYAERGRGVALESVIKQLGPVPADKAQAARMWYHIARMAAQDDDLKAAKSAAMQAVSLEPNALFSAMLMADLLHAEGQHAQAEALVKTYRDANPSLALMGMGAGGLASPEWQGGLDRDMAAVIFDFGVMVWAQGGETPARQLLNLALWLAPDATYTRYYSGIVEEFGGYLPSARARFAPLAGDPMVGLAARLRVAEIDFKLGKDVQAYAQLGELLKAHPKEPSLMRARGEMALEMKDYREAEKLFKQLWDTLPEDAPLAMRAQTAFMIGAAAERQQRYEDAAKWLKTSLEILPENPAVLNYLGYMWVEQGKNIGDAFMMLSTALMLAPEDSAITDSVGWAYYMQGNYEAAATYIERAAEMNPDDATVVDHLGDIYAKTGRMEEARWQWGRAYDMVQNDPDEVALKKALEKKLR